MNDKNIKILNILNFPTALTHEMIDEKISRFFFRTGISLRLVESASFKDLIRSLNPAYGESIPKAKKLSGTLLDQQFTKYSKQLDDLLRTVGFLTLVSDGWSNVRGDHLVNFCVKAPNEKPLFYTSINTTGIIQNAAAVADAIINVIETLGPQKFSCLVTDNANVMRAAWRIIEQKFPHISTNGCSAHAVNLLIKDIVTLNDNAKTVKDAERIIKFCKNHHMVKAKLDDIRTSENITKTLSMPVATRWYSNFTALNDLKILKYCLIKLVDNERQMLVNIAPKSNSVKVINLISSTDFWNRLASLVKVLEFPSNVIGKLEGDDAQLSCVYYYFTQMYQDAQGNEEIQAMIKSRMEFISTPSIGLSYMLTPKYAAEGIYFDDNKMDIIASVQEFAEKISPLDAEAVELQFMDFIEDMNKLTDRRRELIFKMSAKTYWNVAGRDKYPALYKIAQPIVEMIASSAISERVWSIFKFIHSRLRNRLTNERVRKLVFIYTNSVLLDNVDPNDYILDEGAILSSMDCEEVHDDDDA